MLKQIINEEISNYINDDLPAVINKTNAESGIIMNVREVQRFLSGHERKNVFVDNMLKELKDVERKEIFYDLKHVAEIRKLCREMAKAFCAISILNREVKDGNRTTT